MPSNRGRTRLCGVLAAAVLCGVGLPGSASDPAGGADGEARRWTSARTGFAGPVLDPAWFAGRRAVVYLLPDGGDVAAVRRAADEIMRDRWTEGDWSLKHVIVSDVGAARFAARRRVAVRDIAIEITRAAGQGPEFAAENEEFALQNVFFVHDPEGAVWRELLGEPEDGRRAAAVVLLDYGGRVVRVLDPIQSAGESETASATSLDRSERPLAAEVRRSLPSRPELGG
ncbi:MAG TPA: hypothetical protein VF170_20095 [Planctomycetaceae bacterium]